MTKTAYIPQPDGKSQFIIQFQTAKDILKQLRRAELESRPVSKKLAKAFTEPNKKRICNKVWYFLKKEISYEAEPKSNQTAKTINRFIKEKKGDCKHYATFAVGVLNACGIPAWFTLVGQEKGKKAPNHAYCTAMVDNELIIIDPCRKQFNDECRYYYKWNKYPLNQNQ